MSDDAIKVSYRDIEQVIADIVALEGMAIEIKNIDMRLGQSKGSGTEALQSAADAVKTAATSLAKLCQRCCATIQNASEKYADTDSTQAIEIGSIGR